MNLDDVMAKVAETMIKHQPECIGNAFRAEPHRGMCAGSVQYRHLPKGVVGAAAIFDTMNRLYNLMGRHFGTSTPEECNLAVRTFLSACKLHVEVGQEVNLAGLLVFKAQTYSSGTDSWMKPIAVSRDFNRLSTPVSLDRPQESIRKECQAAKLNPFDAAMSGEKAPQATFVHCDQCGHLIKIAQT